MKTPLRFLTILVIVFLGYISYKIIEPELYSDPRDIRDIIGYYPEDDLEILGDGSQTVAARTRSLLDMYQLDWDYDLEGDSPWKIASDWVTTRTIHPFVAPELGAVLREMATAPILSADVGHGGTQLKMTLTLSAGQTVVFKPKWYSRDHVITGKPYDGTDRHNGEIAAFHLGRILGFNRSPLVVGRTVDLETEIKPLAEGRLLNTFFYKDGNTCFYGRCHYCKSKADGVCGDGTVLEGVVVLWLPPSWTLSKVHPHPWRRSYRDGVYKDWETNEDFCSNVLSAPLYSSGPRLLDMMDANVFDYLIGNADRHHYETFNKDPVNSIILMLDNGKSFGNPFHDESSILAPIRQCCLLRTSTWKRLNTLRSGVLINVLKTILSDDPISPILTDAHFEAMQRRLETIILTINNCIQQKQVKSTVLIDDQYSQ